MSTIVNIIVVVFLIAVVVTLVIIAWRYYSKWSSDALSILKCQSSFASMQALETWEANFPNVTFVLTHLVSNRYTLIGTSKTTNSTIISCNLTIG